MIDVKTMSKAVDIIAPYELALEGDNCGVTLDLGKKTDKILVALDATPETVAEAARLGCGILVSHHPAVYDPQKKFTAEDTVIQAARSGVSLVAAHTCYDAASGGVSDVLADAVGLKDICEFGGGLGRGGIVSEMSCDDFIRHVKETLGCGTVFAVPADRAVKRVAIIGGSGGDYIGEAADNGYDAFVTGEVRYHVALSARSKRICLVAAGHYVTENPSIARLCELLQKQIGDTAQCVISKDCADPYKIY